MAETRSAPCRTIRSDSVAHGQSILFLYAIIVGLASECAGRHAVISAFAGCVAKLSVGVRRLTAPETR